MVNDYSYLSEDDQDKAFETFWRCNSTGEAIPDPTLHDAIKELVRIGFDAGQLWRGQLRRK